MVSDICDGVVQATDGMSYSLISRDVMAARIEVHALGHPHDAMVLISGNDKSVPAQLLAMARFDLPAVHVPVLSGNSALSIRAHEAEEAWQVLTPVLDGWSRRLTPLEEYDAGSNGPAAR